MPNQSEIDAILDKAKKDIDALFAIPQPPNAISTDLQLAINKAVPGSSIFLAPDFYDAKPVSVNKPVTIIGSPISNGKAVGGIDVSGAAVVMSSLDIQRIQDIYDIMSVTGDGLTLTNVNVIGRAAGQKRGIAANARNIGLNYVNVTNIWMSDQDAQAIAGWDNMQNFKAYKCTLSAAGETFLVGGADAKSQTRQPSNILLDNCILTKDIKWKTTGVQVKNTLELKNCIGFAIKNSTIEYSWQSAQNGFLIVLTPRNQDGSNPWACVRSVVIDNCKGGHAAALCNMLRTDDEKVSGELDTVVFTNNQFDDINPATWMTSGNWWDHNDQIFLVGGSPNNVTIDKNTITGDHIGSGLYFYQDNSGPRKSTSFNFTNNKYPKSKYGTPSAASPWSDFVANGNLFGNSEL